MLGTLLSAANVAPTVAAVAEQASSSGGLSAEIQEQIECVVLFRIPVPFVDGGNPVYESTVVTWIIMAVIVLIAALLTRNLKVVPTARGRSLSRPASAGSGIFSAIISAPRETGICVISERC